MDIIVKKHFSTSDLKQADLARAAFKRAKATSSASNVLNMADLGKTVCLCDDHVRQFATPAVLSKYGYRQMVDYPHVMGNCDYCQVFGKSQMFIREDLFAEVWRTKEQRRRDYEYSTIVNTG